MTTTATATALARQDAKRGHCARCHAPRPTWAVMRGRRVVARACCFCKDRVAETWGANG